MGPRLFSRGRDEVLALLPADTDASMGPRLFSRGRSARDLFRQAMGSSFNGAAAVQPRKARLRSHLGRLTWASGKRFNGAAAVQPRKAADVGALWVRFPRLQWGRGCSAAEGCGRFPPPGGFRGFNGAAAVQPRKGPEIDFR